jgi:hypothetical protein
MPGNDDFSVFDSLEQFAAVIRRDFEEKAPAEADILARLEGQDYKNRYELLRDLALHLFWVNRYAMTMYDKRPLHWRDVPRHRDDVFLPVFAPRDPAPLVRAVEAGYRALPPAWDEATEDRVFRGLFDIFRHRHWAGAELPAIKPTVAEALARPRALTWSLLAYDSEYPVYAWEDIFEVFHPVPELEALLRQAMVLHNEYPWDRSKMRLVEVGRLDADDWVVAFFPRGPAVRDFIRRVKTGRRTRPPRPAAESRPPVRPYPPVAVRERFRVMPRLAALAVQKGEVPCTNEDLIRNAAWCWSPMSG